MNQPEKEEENVSTAKSFRLQNQRIHLTYSSHIPPEVWLSWLKTTKKKYIPTELSYSIVHEKGESGYPHTHILIDFGKIFQTRNSRFFDWKLSTGEIIHPNIKPVKSKIHWTRSLLYHYKESVPFTNIPKPADENEIKEIWKNDTLTDALLNTCTSLKNVGGVIAAFNCKPSDYGMEPAVDWRPWQKELIEETEKAPDPRSLIWYYDPIGEEGKSFISKHMGQFKGAFVSTKANTYHVATAIDEFLKSNGQNSILVVVFNFTRQQEKGAKIYQALEELKDGMITSEKYKGRTMFFNNPHVICMANYLPDPDTVTKDRWDIRTLQKGKVVKRFNKGNLVFKDPSIDPYIDYSLKEIETKLSSSTPPSIYQANLSSKPDETSRPLNINTGPVQFASLIPPASREHHPASQGLAELANAYWNGNKPVLPLNLPPLPIPRQLPSGLCSPIRVSSPRK